MTEQNEFGARVSGEKEKDEDVKRIFARDLVGLSADGSPCEACGRHMHLHQWADLNANGFVIACSCSPEPPDCTCSAGNDLGFPAQHATRCPRWSHPRVYQSSSTTAAPSEEDHDAR